MSSSTPDEIALFALLYPKSREDLSPVIKGTLPYINDTKESRCSTFCYFTPSKRDGAANHYAKESPNVVAGIEIYAEKAALSHQLEHPSYKKFRDALEKINEKQDQLVAYQPGTQGGFISRNGVQKGDGNVIVIIARMTAREGKRDEAAAIFGKFANWVKDNEPDSLTYAYFTRKKSPDEIFIFERYRGLAALGKHATSPEFKKLGGALGPLLAKGIEISEWTEMADVSFLGKDVEPTKAAPSSPKL